MAIKVYVQGNYFKAEDTVSGKLYEYPMRVVRISRCSATSDSYSFYHDNLRIEPLVDIPWTDIIDFNDNPFTSQVDFDLWKDVNTGSEVSGENQINYRVNTYADLATVATSPIEGELAFVKTATGVPLINRRSSGLYIYTGGNWTNERNEIRDLLQLSADELDVLELEVQSNDTDILNLQNSLSTEVTNRQSVDNALDVRITALENEPEVLYSSLPVLN